MIRTLVVDDEKLARDRLMSFLRNLDDVEVIGQAKNGLMVGFQPTAQTLDAYSEAKTATPKQQALARNVATRP